MCDIRLFKKAYANYNLAENTFKTMEHDEMYLNLIAYNLQQAVELTLKAYLGFIDVIPNTHDIDRLCRMLKGTGSSIILTNWILDNTDTITRWECDTRCSKDYSVELKKIIIGLQEIKKFLHLNGISYDSRLSVEDKNNLLKLCPKGFQPRDEFEWNCYYSVM